MENLTKAVLAVMKEVKNIDKNLKVGTGYNSYQGVSDKDVKLAIGTAMQKHGLIILPIAVESNKEIERWVDNNDRQRQQVFTEVRTRYMLAHSSGESIELQGYGQGVDSQDKSAGKATTYALKYTLLYTFLTPTGAIDDADTTHSDDVPKRESVTEKHEKKMAKKKSVSKGKPTQKEIEKLKAPTKKQIQEAINSINLCTDIDVLMATMESSATEPYRDIQEVKDAANKRHSQLSM